MKPCRWSRLKQTATALALGVALTAEVQAEPAPKPETEQIVPKPEDKPSELSRHETRSSVLAMLPRALSENGRGAFGCTAITPPVILKEDEALELIIETFKAHGIALVRTSAKQPELPKAFLDRRKPHRFDLGTKDGRLMVEFIDEKDARAYRYAKRRSLGSFVYCLDAATAAKSLAEAFSGASAATR